MMKEFLHRLKVSIIALKNNRDNYIQLSNDFYKEHYNENTDKEVQPYIISVFDGSMHHGGLADRLRGIVSIYHYCKLKGREFRIDFHDPFNLIDYLEPNKYDWRISSDEITHDPQKAKPVIFDCDLNLFERYIHKSTIKSLITDRSTQYHVYSNTYMYDEYFHQDFNELFKPTKQLQELIDFYKAEIGGSYISVSFRFAQLLGEFPMDVLRPLSPEDQIALMDKAKEVIKNLKESHQEVKKVLVTSDSNKFVNYIKDMPFVYVIPGEITHSNYASSSDSQMKTFLDFFVIAGAEHVYMARSGQMYKSGFAFRASKISNKPFTEIIF